VSHDYHMSQWCRIAQLDNVVASLKCSFTRTLFISYFIADGSMDVAETVMVCS